MKKLLLVFLLLPVICSADEWYHTEIPLGVLGCDSFFETDCYDDFDEAIRHFWQYMAITGPICKTTQATLGHVAQLGQSQGQEGAAGFSRSLFISESQTNNW